MNHKVSIGALKPIGMGWDLRSYPEAIWRSFETLVATAYALKNRISISGLSNESMRNSWHHSVRQAIAMMPESTDPSFLIPEERDIQLRTRRGSLGSTLLATV